MKQKYTITVADMELNIISDAAPDEVENLVGLLDHRMREINQKSPKCTKNEAAILCALSYCSERLSMQETYKKMEKDAFRLAAENEKLKKTIESMQEEMTNLRRDSDVMRSILDRATLTAVNPTTAPAEKPKYVPTPIKKKEPKADAKAEPKPDTDQLSAFDKPEEKPEEKGGKSRVGSMFDILTFSDI